MEQNNNLFSNGRDKDGRGDLWYVDNYVLLKDYYDRTISRIAARCVRSGNIALEEYPFYGYILDVLEEISETGDYIVAHQELYPYVEKKIAGGIGALKKNLNEFKTELKNNASPEMIKQDKDELDRMKEALGAVDKSTDPTVGAACRWTKWLISCCISRKIRTTDLGIQQQNRPQNQGQAQRPQQQQRQPNQQRPQGQGQQPNRPQMQQGQHQQQRPAAPNGATPVPGSSSPFNNGTK